MEAARKTRLMIIWSLLTAILIGAFWLICSWTIGPVPEVLGISRYFDVLAGPIFSIFIIQAIFKDKTDNTENNEAETHLYFFEIMFIGFSGLLLSLIFMNNGVVQATKNIYLALIASAGLFAFIKGICISRYKEKIDPYFDFVIAATAMATYGIYPGLLIGLIFALLIGLVSPIITVIGFLIVLFFKKRTWKKISDFLLAKNVTK